MSIPYSHSIKNVVTAIVVTLFFACENDFDDVQKVGVLQNQPIAEAEHIDLKYTELKNDSVRLLANLISPKMLDYSNRDFAFSEFPDGILLKVYDESGKMTTIKSNRYENNSGTIIRRNNSPFGGISALIGGETIEQPAKDLIPFDEAKRGDKVKKY